MRMIFIVAVDHNKTPSAGSRTIVGIPPLCHSSYVSLVFSVLEHRHWICWESWKLKWLADANLLDNNIGRLVKSVSFQLCLDGMADVCAALERIHVCFKSLNCIMRVLWRGTQPQSPPQSQGCLLIETCLHNLIFYLLISLTEAASCHSSQARINGNIVPEGEGPGRVAGWMTGLQSSGSWTRSQQSMSQTTEPLICRNHTIYILDFSCATTELNQTNRPAGQWKFCHYLHNLCILFFLQCTKLPLWKRSAHNCFEWDITNLNIYFLKLT